VVTAETMADPDQRAVGKSVACGQPPAFNLQAATRTAAKDKDGLERGAATSCGRLLPMTG